MISKFVFGKSDIYHNFGNPGKSEIYQNSDGFLIFFRNLSEIHQNSDEFLINFWKNQKSIRFLINFWFFSDFQNSVKFRLFQKRIRKSYYWSYLFWKYVMFHFCFLLEELRNVWKRVIVILFWCFLAWSWHYSCVCPGLNM